ncbi:MAG: protease modulator HflC [Geminicoccaceae bacterium]
MSLGLLRRLDLNPRILIGAGIAVLLVLFLLYSSLFTVYQTQQALVLQFGNPVRIVQDPGLHMKVPFVQQVEYFEKRVLDFDAPSVELVLGDQKRLVVDAFARYRITDALRFRRSVGNETAFRGRLEPIIFSSLRSVLGEVPLFSILSQDRNELMRRIQTEANRALAGFGVELVDVRIKRADLPPENSQAVFRRMQTEREREAKELRAQGAEIGQRIRARADRERRVIIAEAERESQITRGQGDGEAIKVFADAFGQDPAFFDFYRSMQAYRTALTDSSTSLVLSPDSEFFRFFNALPAVQLPGKPAAAAGNGAASAPAAPAAPQP